MFDISEIIAGIVLIVIGYIVNYFSSSFGSPLNKIMQVIGIVVIVIGIIVVILGILGYGLVTS
jgi:hypothetical protein